MENLKTNQEIATSIKLNIHQFVNYKAAEKYLLEKGLTLTTTPRQFKLGSIGIMDPHTKRKFAITKAGYIRTYVQSSYYWNPSATHQVTYQLNPRNTPSPIGYSQSRILFPLEYNYMAMLLWKSIKRIRKN